MSALLLVLVWGSRASAQVSCANPDDLCTGDPCTMTNVEVQSPCVVDFGARTLVIAGILRVPDGGTLSLTAASIVQQGPIDGRHVGNGVGSGAAITLITTVGDAELRGEIDVAGTVATGSINVQAAGDILVKDNLIAKPAGSNMTAIGGTIALDAAGTATTDQTAVLDTQGANQANSGGVIFVAGDLGVTIGGRTRAEGNPGGSIIVASNAGSVTLAGDLRVLSEGGPGGLVLVTGETGVAVNDNIRAASELTVGGTVTLTSPSGDVTINDGVSVAGTFGGSISINAPLGSVTTLAKLKASATTEIAGTVGIGAATITLRANIDARSRSGSGGQVTLAATTVVDLVGGDADARGKLDGGAIALLGGGASGDVTVRRSSKLYASGSQGNGGSLVASAPAGAVTIEGPVALSGSGMGGQAQVDGVAVTVNRAHFDADGRTLGGGELRFNQSGAGLLLLEGTFEARDNGAIEALAPAGNLTARGKFRVRPAGCVGFSAGGTLDTNAAAADVALTPTCP
jgi:hypothetical protein